jgi:small subunit ribosomal protein S1
LTEEQQGGTTPTTDAAATVDPEASDRPAGAIAVADEPSETPAADSETPTEASANGAASTVSPAASTEDTSAAAVAESDDTAAPEAVADSDEMSAPEAVAESDDTAAPQAVAETDDTAARQPVAESGDMAAPGAVAETEPGALADAGANETVAATEVAEPETPAAEATASEAPAAEPEGTPAEPPAPPRDLGPEPTTMEELLAEQESDIKSFKHGDVVEGTVVRIDKDEILVDIGAKSEGVVSNRELFGRHGGEGQAPLTIGDTVLVYVLQPESPEGHAVLSLRRAGLERKWRAMQEQFEAGVIIEAPVIDHNKGGLIVDCGIRGFVPISQIVDFPRRPQNDQPRDAAQEIAEKLQPFVGRKLRLKILEVNRKANRLILSEKVALYEERREKRDELFSSLQVGQKVSGTVRSIAPFGVFIDLGGIDGLVHKSELSWNKVNNPEAGYKVGDEVEAEVIDINHERGRISLSIRRLQPDPWHSTVADFKVGDIIDGTVTKLVNFGAFVRVRDGLEGLIHISELSHQRVAHPGDVVHEGQQLKLKIISLDSERHRLGLSLKQAEEPPARPAVEPGQAPSGGRPERRGGRQERGYSMSDAIQEPEGGIDDTLASAFAQVRQQLAEAEGAPSAESAAEPTPDATAGAEPETAATADGDEPSTATADAEEPPTATAEADEPPTGTAEADEPPTATAEPAETGADAPVAETSVEAEEPPASQPEAALMTPRPAASAGEGVVAEAATEPIATDEPATEGDAASAATPAEAVSPEDEQPVAEAEATAGAPATEDETKT